MATDVYYKIMKTDEDLLTVVCLQWFDEYDYDQEDFFTSDDGDQLQFWDFEGETYVNGREKAIKWLNENVKLEKIDPRCRKVKFNREDYLK